MTRRALADGRNSALFARVFPMDPAAAHDIIRPRRFTTVLRAERDHGSPRGQRAISGGCRSGTARDVEVERHVVKRCAAAENGPRAAHGRQRPPGAIPSSRRPDEVGGAWRSSCERGEFGCCRQPRGPWWSRSIGEVTQLSGVRIHEHLGPTTTTCARARGVVLWLLRRLLEWSSAELRTSVQRARQRQ